MTDYICPVCGKPVKEERSEIHNHYVDELSKKFQRERYKIIREGKMPIRGKWFTPDLFILQNSKLVKVVEVIVLDPYENGDRSVKEKVKKIKNYYSPQEIIMFEPTNYLDQFVLPEKKNQYRKELGYEPKSYTQIEEYYANKWKKEELDVIFWNEKNIIH